MKFKFILFTFHFSLFTSLLFSQYFQQEVNYKINVTLDDIRHELNAFETIEYVNNSPNALSEIYFHLWPNAYRDNSTALVKQKIENGDTDLYFATEDDRGYIDQLDFKIGDVPVKMVYDSLNIDICKLLLKDPLRSGEKIMITTPFHVKIPSSRFSRFGHLGQAYFITQWYPKPAVYDQFGWHTMPYLDYGEFYSEFGSFEVNISLPENYVVGATGELQNDTEIKWLEGKVRTTKKTSDFSNDMSFPPSAATKKTIAFKEKNIHDFAWFADKRFHVLKSEVHLPHTKNKVTTWALFTNSQAKWWTEAVLYIDSALYYYSLWNGDYPYRNCTAVDGSNGAVGGMEYPGVTIIGESLSEFELEDVIVHEVGHNWFYGILGSNERDHGWMDEGINSFNEMRYVYTKYAPETSKGLNDLAALGRAGKIIGIDELDFRQGFAYEYLLTARVHRDQPVDITSEDFTLLNYGAVMYRKTALIFDYLKSYLGDSLFDACMKQYFDEWKFKHPYPDDFRKIFESRTGKNLGWFFDDLLKTNKKIDYSISNTRPLRGANLLNPAADSYGITIANKGDVIAPFSYSIIKDGEEISKKWVEGFSGSQQIQITCNNCDEIKIDAAGDIPEINQKNNSIKTKGLFKKVEALQFKFLGRFEDPDRTQVYFTPVIGFNNYDKFMIGSAFYNKFLPNKKLEYILIPMYSFEAKSLNGIGNISLSIYPESKFFHEIDLSASLNHFNYNSFFADIDDFLAGVEFDHYVDFYKLPFEANLKLNKKKSRSPVSREINFRNINLWFQEFRFDSPSPKTTRNYLNYNQVSFVLTNKRKFDPFAFSVTMENGRKYLKSNFEFNYKFSYRNTRRGVDVRLFAGVFIFNSETERNYNYRMSGWRGYQDYLFDEIYLGRSEFEGRLSQQMYVKDGGFKMYSPVGQTNKWITSLNVLIDFPGRLPLRLFGDLGTYDGAKNAFPGSEAIMFDGGICLSLIKSVAEVYFPLFKSSDIKQALEANDIKYKEQIRFVLNFKLMNPFRLRDYLLK